MTTKLITENILTEGHFLSATEQGGAYVGQPVADSANVGAFKLISTGEADNYTYDGEATTNGSTTTIIDSDLSAFGDDYFINATVTITESGHTAEDEVRTVSDFVQSTGTLTVSSAFSAAINSGDAYTLTLVFVDTDFRVELITGGNAGAATFKWSHDGGTTYLGRDDPDSASWPGENEVYGAGADAADVAEDDTYSIVQAPNGDLVAFYRMSTGDDEDIYCSRSTDNGMTWEGSGSHAAVGTTEDDPDPLVLDYYQLGKAAVTNEGRILVPTRTRIFYSDDNGSTWDSYLSLQAAYTISTDLYYCDSGRVLMTLIVDYGGVTTVHVYSSADNGESWVYLSVIVSNSETDCAIESCAVLEMANGNYLAVYSDDVATAGEFLIRGKLSTDGGLTWGSASTIVAYGSNAKTDVDIIKDTDGRMFLSYGVADTDDYIDFVVSSDNGESWGAAKTLKTVASYDLSCPAITMINGHEFICAYKNSDTSMYFVRAGYWETYGSNACACAPTAKEQGLIGSTGIVWHGGNGTTGDSWAFTPGYTYAMENIISHSPAKTFRTTQDNIACNIVIDLGANNRFFADGVGLFGCNFRTCNVQMNASNSWGAPSIDEAISFDLATGEADEAAQGNTVKDTSLLLNYKYHELKNLYLRDTESGATAENVTWKISDNADEYIFLDTTAASSIADEDAFAIFQNKISKTFTGGLYRFIRINIPAQQTVDDYYEIGTLVIGQAVPLTNDFSIGYSKSREYNIDMIKTPSGGLLTQKKAEPKNIFNLTWAASDDSRNEILALSDYNDHKNIVFIPNHSTLTDCYLVKSTTKTIQQQQVHSEYFNFMIELTEVL